jgi:hypothetical protein
MAEAIGVNRPTRRIPVFTVKHNETSLWNAKLRYGTPILLLNELSITNIATKRIDYNALRRSSIAEKAQSHVLVNVYCAKYLKLSMPETNDLLKAAGFKPEGDIPLSKIFLTNCHVIVSCYSCYY